MRLSNLLGAAFVASFIVWAGADWGVKPAAKDVCLSRSVPLEKCEAYQQAFVVSSFSGYAASASAGTWLVLTQLLDINPLLIGRRKRDNSLTATGERSVDRPTALGEENREPNDH